jgi:hypothetical protein
MFLTIRWSGLLGAFLCATAAPSAARDCGLEFIVFSGESPADMRLAQYRVQSFLSVDGIEHAPSFSGLRADLPCGRYRYELVRSDINTQVTKLAGEIDLENRRQVLTLESDRRTILVNAELAVAVEQRRNANRHLVGSVGGSIPPGITFVRMISLTTNEAATVALDGDRRFEFHGPLPGAYVVLLLQPGRLLGSKVVLVSGFDAPIPPIEF